MQRYQTGFWFYNLQTELLCHVMGKSGGSHFRDRQTSRGQYETGRFKCSSRGLYNVMVGLAHGGDLHPEFDVYVNGSAFRHQHRHDLPRRAIAEQLTQGFFVPGNLVLFNQRQKIFRRVARQGGPAKMQIG